MQQIKIFKGVESDLADLENDVNSWLRETGHRVLSLTGNIAPQSSSGEGSRGLTKSPFSPSDIMIVVVYETD